MNNDIVPIDQISSEQHHHIDNQQDQSLTEIGLKLKGIGIRVKETNTAPMNPTPLYLLFIFFFSLIIEIFV